MGFQSTYKYLKQEIEKIQTQNDVKTFVNTVNCKNIFWPFQKLTLQIIKGS